MPFDFDLTAVWHLRHREKVVTRLVTRLEKFSLYESK